MKKKIRKGVFETNSSSTHSYTLSDKMSFDSTLVPDDKGTIHIDGGYFGWNKEKHNDAATKASYLAVRCTYSGNYDNFLAAIMEQTDCEEVKFNFEIQKSLYTRRDDKGDVVVGEDDRIKDYDFGIDHGCEHDMPTTKEDIKNFIFNKNCWLTTGNDNDGDYFEESDLDVDYSEKGPNIRTTVVCDDYPELNFTSPRKLNDSKVKTKLFQKIRKLEMNFEGYRIGEPYELRDFEGQISLKPENDQCYDSLKDIKCSYDEKQKMRKDYYLENCKSIKYQIEYSN